MKHNKLTSEDQSAGFYRNDQGKIRVFEAGGVDAVKLLKSVDLVEFPSRRIEFDGPPIGGFHASNVWGSNNRYKLTTWKQMSNAAKRYRGVLPRQQGNRVYKSARVLEQEADQRKVYSGMYAEAVYSALCLRADLVTIPGRSPYCPGNLSMQFQDGDGTAMRVVPQPFDLALEDWSPWGVKEWWKKGSTVKDQKVAAEVNSFPWCRLEDVESVVHGDENL